MLPCDRRYMSHAFQGKRVGTVAFRPYEDILGIGHATGICSMVVPGSGEPNYDAFEANPCVKCSVGCRSSSFNDDAIGMLPGSVTFASAPRYETRKQRREGGVQKLLDQLPPDTIVLNPDEIATVDRTPQEVIMRERKLAREANLKGKVVKVKNKARGYDKMLASATALWSLATWFMMCLTQLLLLLFHINSTITTAATRSARS